MVILKVIISHFLLVFVLILSLSAQPILILDDNGTQDSVSVILSDAGFDVEPGGHYWNFSDQDVSGYDLIILLNGVSWTNAVPQAGQENLRNYVLNGGILLTTEWISWSGATNETINDIIPVNYDGYWNRGSETYTVTESHPITAGLPETFNVPTQWSFSRTVLKEDSELNPVMLIEGSISKSAVSIGEFGNGRVIHWNMGGHYNGRDIWSGEVKLILENIAQFAGTFTSLSEENEHPARIALYQNYPNPFNPSTVIRYHLPEAGEVTLEVFDMLGRRMDILINGRAEAGTHEIQFDASYLTSGVYLYRLTAGNAMMTKKLTLIK